MMANSVASEPSPKKTYRAMAFVAVAIIALLSLAIYSLSRLQTKPWASSLSALEIQSTFRKDLPQFELKDGEKVINPQHFLGHWTLLTFWSYSCPPCLQEMPSLNALALGWQGEELEVLTVNVDPKDSENFTLAKKWLLEEEIELPTVFDRDQVLNKAFAVTEYPRHFLIDREGKIVWEASGAYAWNEPMALGQLLKLTERQDPEAAPDPVE
jgi:thiol-disulfide isomerase/thioredoxin